MKILHFLFFLFSSLLANAQWQFQSNPKLTNLIALDFLSDSVLVAVKADSLFFGKPNDAAHWEGRAINGLKFLPPRFIKNGLVDFVSKDMGFAALDVDPLNFQIYKIEGMGNSTLEIAKISKTKDDFLIDLEFFDDTIGCLLTRNNLYITLNGGLTWEAKNSPAEASVFELNPVKLHLYPDGRGSIVGLESIMVTRNFGTTWMPYNFTRENDLKFENNKPVDNLAPYDVFFEGNNIFILGSPSVYTAPVNDCYELNESTHIITRFFTKGKDFQAVWNGGWNHAVFFSKDNFQFVADTFASKFSSGFLNGPGIFQAIDTTLLPVFYFSPDLRGRFVVDHSCYSPGHKKYAYIDKKGNLMLYETDYCNKIKFNGFEIIKDSRYGSNIKIDNLTGTGLSYPGANIHTIINDSMIKVAETQAYVAPTGSSSLLFEELNRLDTTKMIYVLIWNNLGKQACSYTYTPLPVTLSNISEVEKSDISIYPNPGISYFQIKGMKLAEISIADLSGKIVFSKTALHENEIFDIEELTKGIYFVNIKSVSGESLLKKLIKN